MILMRPGQSLYLGRLQAAEFRQLENHGCQMEGALRPDEARPEHVIPQCVRNCDSTSRDCANRRVNGPSAREWERVEGANPVDCGSISPVNQSETHNSDSTNFRAMLTISQALPLRLLNDFDAMAEVCKFQTVCCLHTPDIANCHLTNAQNDTRACSRRIEGWVVPTTSAWKVAG